MDRSSRNWLKASSGSVQVRSAERDAFMHTALCRARVVVGRVGRSAWSRSLHDCDSVIVEDCGDIFGGELVGGIADEETCLSDRTVTNDNASAARD